jgi:hypothetical protein
VFSFDTSIDLTAFYKNYKRFKQELSNEMRVALVNTREDFVMQVISIVGSVPAEGGDIPAPYVAFYMPLTSKWIEIKRQRGWMRNIGTASGELLNWLIQFAQSPEQVAVGSDFQEITMNPNVAPDSVKEKILMMEGGLVRTPQRPIFSPVVAYVTKEGTGTSFFYREAIKARDRAIARVYGNA